LRDVHVHRAGRSLHAVDVRNPTVRMRDVCLCAWCRDERDGQAGRCDNANRNAGWPTAVLHPQTFAALNAARTRASLNGTRLSRTPVAS
jgi:hypothetical protein